MNKSQTAAAAAILAASLGLAAPASAGLVIQAGDYKMSFDNYDSGTVGYGTALGVVCSAAPAEHKRHPPNAGVRGLAHGLGIDASRHWLHSAHDALPSTRFSGSP